MTFVFVSYKSEREKKRSFAHLIQNLLCGKVDSLVELRRVLVELDRLLPVVKGAGDKHLMGGMRPEMG